MKTFFGLLWCVSFTFALCFTALFFLSLFFGLFPMAISFLIVACWSIYFERVLTLKM